jgi:hypothetical protein
VASRALNRVLWSWRLVLAAVLVAGVVAGAAPALTARADSGIVFVGTVGTGAPPATLGPYTMAPFPADGRPLFDDVTDVPGPTGALRFDGSMSHMRANPGGSGGWSSPWSHGYRGDVYFSNYRTQVVMTLPADTYAFYFYAQGNTIGWNTITATAQDGTTSGPVQVFSSLTEEGAVYFGFYSTGAPLTTITVSYSTSSGFAVGEFGIYSGPVIDSSCTRADVAVVVYGGWDGIPVNASVGGTAQEALYTARDAFGNAAVLWTFYPAAGGWPVSVAPQLPAGLDPARWQYRLVGLEVNGRAVENPASAGATISPCSEHVFYFQLVDTGARPAEE